MCVVLAMSSLILVTIIFYSAFWNCTECYIEYQSYLDDYGTTMIDQGIISEGAISPDSTQTYTYVPESVHITSPKYRVLFRECYTDTNTCTYWRDLWVEHNAARPAPPYATQ